MIRKFLLTSVAAIFLMLLNASAYANGVTITQGQSITYTFTTAQFPGTTASATVTLSGNQLIFSVTNTSTDGTTRLKGFGINTTPDLQVTSASFSGGLSNFQFSTGGGLGNMEAIASSAGNKTLNQGSNNSGIAVFTLSSAPTSLLIDQITVHLISLPNGDSIKLNGTPTTEPIPEPATMLLLGTGLAGAAIKARRRRKAQDHQSA